MSFSKDVRKFTAKYQKRLEATAKTAVQDLEGEISTVTGDGGRLRIDTGFLRVSFGWGLGNMPAGPTKGEPGVDYRNSETLTGDPLAVALAKWDFSQPLYGGFSANYARFREFRDGFVRGGTEKWDSIVSSAAKRAKARIR